MMGVRDRVSEHPALGMNATVGEPRASHSRLMFVSDGSMVLCAAGGSQGTGSDRKGPMSSGT
jgi:hypothetical protein